MAIDFSSAVNDFRDDLGNSALATAIADWLDGLSITTVYDLTIHRFRGFWKVIVVYA